MGEDDYSWLYDVFPQDSGVVPHTASGGSGGGAGAFGVSEGDNENAGGFTNPNTWGGQSSSPQIGGGGGGNIASQILKALGLGSSGTDPNLMQLLTLLAPILGGVMASNTARTATNQVGDQIKAANTLLGGYASDAQSRYAPIIGGAQNAFNRAGGIASGYTPLAPRFPALGAPAAGAQPLNAIFNSGRG